MPDGPRARTSTMAQILGITRAKMLQLVDEGTLPDPVAKDAWDVISLTTAYLDIWKRDDEAGGIKSEELQLIRAQRLKVDAERKGQELKNTFDAKRLEIMNAQLDALKTAELDG